jgi:hypothetical protein
MPPAAKRRLVTLAAAASRHPLMETSRLRNSIPGSAAELLRGRAGTWLATGVLPLPVLVAADPGTSAGIACAYLGLGCSWLTMEIYRNAGGPPASMRDWSIRMLAIGLAVAVNVATFIVFGMAAGVQTAFPFPLMAVLSAVPAVGMIPWLARRVSRPYVAMVLGSVLVFASKLCACVVARIRYGPDYIAQGYVSADWGTAKLMISLFWTFSTSLSLALLLAEYAKCRRPSPAGPAAHAPAPRASVR